MINNHTDTIAAMINLFKDEKNIMTLEELFLEYEKAPIDFNYSTMANYIKDFAKCKNINVDVNKLDNFDDLKVMILKAVENNLIKPDN